MPAAAVIPAPLAYINVVAVKKLVVGFLAWGRRSALQKVCTVRPRPFWTERSWHSVVGSGMFDVYCEKIRVFKAGLRLEYISME